MANDILAKMAVQIDANTAGFNKGLAQLNGSITKTQGVFSNVAKTLGGIFVADKVKDFAIEITKLAGEAKGVQSAFDRLPESVKVLEELKRATGGTVSELDLMKRTVQAANFGISLSALPKLLEFATLRAQQTGQSVDYLVDSIVTGIGRKSPLILDNLGISAVALKDALGGVSTAAASVGQVAEAVGKIAGDNLQNMAGFSDNASTAIQKLSAEWTNFKVALGTASNDTGIIGTSLKIVTDLVKNITDQLKGEDSQFSFLEGLGIQAEETKKQLEVTAVAFKALNDFAQKYYGGDVKKAQEEFINNQYKEILNLQIEKAAIDELTAVSGESFKDSIDGLNLEIETRRKIIAAIESQGKAVETLNKVGIVAGLEEQIKLINEGIQTAGSIAEIRKLQAELEITKSRLNDILKPPEDPIIIPVEFNMDLDQLDGFLKSVDIPDVVVDIEALVTPESTESLDKFIDKLKETQEEAARLAEVFSNTVRSGIQNVLVGFAEDLGNAAAGVGNFGDNIIAAVADFAKQFGALLISAGLAKIAFDKLAISGVGAVVAGVALVAAAGAVSAHLKKSSSAMTSGSVGSSSSTSRAYSGSSISSQAQNSAQSEITFQLKGQDIWGSLNNFNKNNRFTRAGNG